jgi:hypothetical protein
VKSRKIIAGKKSTNKTKKYKKRKKSRGINYKNNNTKRKNSFIRKPIIVPL